MEYRTLLAIVQKDLQLISRLRSSVVHCSGWALKLARSSDEAVLYLRGVGVYSDRNDYPIPSLIVLDTESEDHSDLEVLSWVRGEKRYRELPIAMLSSERHPHLESVCALDRFSFLIDRDSLDDLPKAIYLGVFAAKIFASDSIMQPMPGW
jgi:hypothetical protein